MLNLSCGTKTTNKNNPAPNSDENNKNELKPETSVALDDNSRDEPILAAIAAENAPAIAVTPEAQNKPMEVLSKDEEKKVAGEDAADLVVLEDDTVTVIPIPPLFGDHAKYAEGIKARRCGTRPTLECLRNRTIIDKYRFTKKPTSFWDNYSEYYLNVILRRQRIEQANSNLEFDVDFSASDYDSIDSLAFVFKEGNLQMCTRFMTGENLCIADERCDKARYYAVAFGLIDYNTAAFQDELHKSHAPIFNDPKDPRKGILRWESCIEAAATYGELYDWDIGGMELIIKPEETPAIERDQFFNAFRCKGAKELAANMITPEEQMSFNDPSLFPRFNGYALTKIIAWDKCENVAETYGDLFDDISNWLEGK